MGERWFEQEFNCAFHDDIGALFSNDDIEAAESYAVEPLFPQ